MYRKQYSYRLHKLEGGRWGSSFFLDILRMADVTSNTRKVFIWQLVTLSLFPFYFYSQITEKVEV